MAHFGNIILTPIVTHGNSDKIRRDKSCHYWRAYLYYGQNQFFEILSRQTYICIKVCIKRIMISTRIPGHTLVCRWRQCESTGNCPSLRSDTSLTLSHRPTWCSRNRLMDYLGCLGCFLGLTDNQMISLNLTKQLSSYRSPSARTRRPLCRQGWCCCYPSANSYAWNLLTPRNRRLAKS